MKRQRPRLAVVYDRGAASVGDVAVGLRDVADVVFVLPGTAHATKARPVCEQLGSVLDLSGDPAADARALAGLGVQGVLTFSDPMLRIAADLAASLKLPFHEPATALRLTDKVAQRRALRGAGIENVRSHPIADRDDWAAAVASVGLPAVVKPTWGEGSRCTYLIHEGDGVAEMVDRALAEAPPATGPRLILEEMLTGRTDVRYGDYVSVESLSTAEGAVHLAITGKFPLVAPFREPGQFWPAPVETDEAEEILRLTTRALKALGVVTGLSHVEIKLTPGGPRIIEVNGRLGGHINELSRRACGVDLVTLAGHQALGAETAVTPLRPSGVHYQHHTLAPVQPCRLLGIDGAAAVRRLPGVLGHRQFVRPDDDLPGGVMTQELDILWGQCPDHDAMSRSLEQALTLLSYRFRFADCERSLKAAELSAFGATPLTYSNGGSPR